MKFMAIVKAGPKYDGEKLLEKFNELQKIREKSPGLFPKVVAAYTACGGTGYQIYETEDAEQLTRLAQYYDEILEVDFFPVIETSKAVELSMKKWRIWLEKKSLLLFFEFYSEI